ncbi:MAG: fumarylacetoacetate hydrolase family protein [Lachnospiraceae bacterium]
MKLVTYAIEKREMLGALSADEEWIFPFQAFDMEYKTMLEAVKSMSESELQLLNHSCSKDPESIRGAVRIGEVNLLSPIPHPEQDIICLGINYMEHAAESARFKKESFDGERPYAVYFSKRVNATTAAGAEISAHADIVDSLDYEAELAVIIGQDAKQVAPEDVKNYIFGYTILNDISARNIQNLHKQWYFGKSLDGFAPMGPCILTTDSVAYPPQLDIQSYVNGELRQNSNTRQLIFNLDHIVSELSQGMTLKAGTIISTGTPAGVGLGFNPPRFLKSGDVVECRIEGIGSLTNPVK